MTGGNASVIDGQLSAAGNLWLINPAGVTLNANASLNLGGSFHASSAHYLKLADGGVLHASLSATSTLTSAPPSAFGFVGPAAPVAVNGAQLSVVDGRSVSLVGGSLTLNDALILTGGGDVLLAAAGGPNELSLAQRAWSAPPGAGDAITLSNTVVLASGPAAGGQIALRGGTITLQDGAALASDNNGGAQPSRGISLEASGDVALRGAIILSSTFSGSAAGAVTLRGRDVAITDDTLINTDSFLSGRGGTVDIAGRNILISGGGTTFSVRSLRSGDAGDLRLAADGRITLEDGALIGTDSRHAGRGGAVSLVADEVLLNTSGAIRSTSDGLGAGGQVSISGRRSVVIGSSGLINVDTKGPGLGGEVVISSGGDVQLSGLIFSGSQAATANDAGSVTVNAGGTFAVLPGGLLSTQTISSHKAGDIRVNAGAIDIGRDGVIESSSARRDGPGGSISLSANTIHVHDGGVVSASSAAQGLAGRIALVAGQSVTLSGGGAITTEALQADGGDITVTARDLIHLRDSRITTSVDTNTGSGGNITLDPTFVVLDSSEIIARAAKGSGGNISIITDFFLSQASVVDASSQAGISGVVAISAPKTDLSSGLVVLASNFLVAHRLSETCAARASRGSSSFIAAGRGGLPSFSAQNISRSDATSAGAPWSVASSTCSSAPRLPSGS